jgi:hypothetical protein
MEGDSQEEREVRAARNQALFRAINENMRALNEAFSSVTKTFAITCECADKNCIEIIEIDPHQYLAVRGEPRHFAVLPGHVYLDVERIVREVDGYVVVEKMAAAGDVAEVLASEVDTERR